MVVPSVVFALCGNSVAVVNRSSDQPSANLEAKKLDVGGRRPAALVFDPVPPRPFDAFSAERFKNINPVGCTHPHHFARMLWVEVMRQKRSNSARDPFTVTGEVVER